jgi:hypothetical protein
LKETAKKLLLQTMPGPAEALQRAWRRRHMRRFEASLGLPKITAAFVGRYGWRVVSGPFEGMDYIQMATGSMLMPKLIGSYEAELAPAMEYIFTQNYDSIVDIGCAEGYYAVGMARRFPMARVFAFDTDPHAKRLCSDMARINGVHDRVTVGGAADFATLQQSLTRRSLTICDCDGCEAFLLDPSRVEAFRTGDILVELHDHIDAAISPTLEKNFAATHDITTFNSVERDPAEWKSVEFLSPEERKIALGEYRPPQRWFLMTPRKGKHPAHA